MICFVGSLFLFSKFAGLDTHRRKMFRLMKDSSSFVQCVQTFLKCKGFVFGDHRICHPLDTIPDTLYLLQIASRLNDVIDNSHSICIYNGKIYDYNHKLPLILTEKSIDRCCVGSDWKFDHVSRMSSFVPTFKMKKHLDLHLLS